MDKLIIYSLLGFLSIATISSCKSNKQATSATTESSESTSDHTVRLRKPKKGTTLEQRLERQEEMYTKIDLNEKQDMQIRCEISETPKVVIEMQCMQPSKNCKLPKKVK